MTRSGSSAEFQRLLVRAGSVIDNLGLVGAHADDALGQQMALFGEMAQELPQANRRAPQAGRPAILAYVSAATSSTAEAARTGRC